MKALLLLSVAISTISAINLDNCNVALGMETGEIADKDVSASSSFDEASVGAQYARIRTDESGGAWCPEHQVSRDVYEWIQVDLHVAHVISAVESQGRYGRGNGLEYAPNYLLEYWRPGLSHWVRYKNRRGEEVVEGNKNTHTSVIRQLDTPIVASKIRIVPWSVHPRTVCMRIELYGCPYRDSILAYSAPQGYKVSGLELRDTSYDGIAKDGQLRNGLGKLNDGILGRDGFRFGTQDWVGWRNTSNGATLPISFEFTEVRNLSAVWLHCNNQFKEGVKVFSAARLKFSLDGKTFSKVPADYIYIEDSVIETARWVKIPITNRLAKVIVIELNYNSPIMLISEIKFDSTLMHGIMTDQLKSEYSGTTEIVPILFNEVDLSADSSPIGTFSLKDMPSELIGLVVGVAVLIVAVCLMVIIALLVRHKKAVANLPYSAYGGFTVVPKKEFQLVHSSLEKIRRSGSDHFGNFDLEVEPHDRLPLTAPPKRVPSGFSPPPDYSYSRAVTSEYAEPDTSSGEFPQIPPPPQSNKRRSLKPSATFDNDQNEFQVAFASGSYGRYSGTNQKKLPKGKIVQLKRKNLKFQEKLGEGEFGEVHLCELLSEANSSESTLVAVKFLRTGSDDHSKSDFEKETKVLSKLRHPNIVQLIGVCQTDEPWLMAIEYMANGDLNQFLQAQKLTNSIGCEELLQMGSEIAAGMKFLESLSFVHRDLATRNCLVGVNNSIKIGDFGMARGLYSADYYRIEGKFVLPIRWMAWETILLGKFTPKSDVWAFGVTMWEIFTYAQFQPYAELSDDQVIDNIQHLYHTGALQAYLSPPENCPREIFDLLQACWLREEADRPSFADISNFFTKLLACS